MRLANRIYLTDNIRGKYSKCANCGKSLKNKKRKKWKAVTKRGRSYCIPCSLLLNITELPEGI